METSTLTKVDIKALEEIRDNLIGTKNILEANARTVTNMINKYSKPKSEAAKKRDERDAEMITRINLQAEKKNLKRYG